MTAKYEAIQRWPISFLAKIQKERPHYTYIPNSESNWLERRRMKYTHEKATTTILVVSEATSFLVSFFDEMEWIVLRQQMPKSKIELHGKCVYDIITSKIMAKYLYLLTYVLYKWVRKKCKRKREGKKSLTEKKEENKNKPY